jgi:DNA-binding beta-propeller fold protein YncE
MDAYTQPARKYVAVTKSDTTVYDFRALYVGGTGNVVIRAPGSSTSVTFSGVPGGTILPIAGEKVMDATTATNIVALY